MAIKNFSLFLYILEWPKLKKHRSAAREAEGVRTNHGEADEQTSSPQCVELIQLLEFQFIPRLQFPEPHIPDPNHLTRDPDFLTPRGLLTLKIIEGCWQ